MRLFSPFYLSTVKIGEDCTGFLLLKKNFFAVNFPESTLTILTERIYGSSRMRFLSILCA